VQQVLKALLAQVHKELLGLKEPLAQVHKELLALKVQ
jgi:hypothetical protein